MGQCISPFTVKNKMTNQSIPVPCGRCPNCFARRVSGWSFRLMQEELRSQSAHFITLTYDTTYVTITPAGYMSLNKDDVQKFFKRLRKNHGLHNAHYPIKYYLAGEYGGKTLRPHYHAIIFNLRTPTEVDRAWGKGSVHYGQVTGASVGYTLKYMSKTWRPMHRNDDRLPVFGLQSKGLGENYLTPSILQYHHADLTNRMCLTLNDGRKIAMPRYYKQKLYTDNDKKRIAFTLAPLREKQQQLKELRIPNYNRNLIEAHIELFKNFKQKHLQDDKL